MSEGVLVLNSEEINNISSEYLREGRKKDVWDIVQVTIKGNTLEAHVRMLDYYKSPSDAGGFHLTSFSTMEFVSQLFIVYGHVLADLKDKTQEAWMMDSSIKCTKAIRNAEHIRVEMKFRTLKKIKNRLLGSASARIWDDQGGEFTATVKALLA
jgi:hypothetical protein